MEVLIVLAIIAVVMGLLVGPQLVEGDTQAKRRQTQIEEQQLLGAHLLWTYDHPGDQCPKELKDLGTYVRRRHMNDPWGTAYEMRCGPGTPVAAEGFGVTSYAQDRTPSTRDDINSWQ